MNRSHLGRSITRAAACTVLSLLIAAAASAQPTLMSAEWAAEACEAWNGNETLTGKLEKWVTNDKGRGHKVIQLYRTDCEESDLVELRQRDRAEQGAGRLARGGEGRA